MQNIKPELKLDFCSYDAAKFAVMNWHYSKCMPVGKLFKIGVWENKKFIGCVLFSNLVGASGAKTFGLTHQDVCELVRVALDKHTVAVSKIVSIAIKLLKKNNPALKLIVSFADPEQKHIGSIYQAGNWIYIGRSTSTKFWILPNGEKIHDRVASPNSPCKKQFGIAKKTYDMRGAKEYNSIPKYKYVYVLDETIKEKIYKLRKPYPKRVEHESNACVNQTQESGAVPTNTLQT